MGKSTSIPRRSRTSTVAFPVSGKSVSLKQVIKSATRKLGASSFLMRRRGTAWSCPSPHDSRYRPAGVEYHSHALQRSRPDPAVHCRALGGSYGGPHGKPARGGRLLPVLL